MGSFGSYTIYENVNYALNSGENQTKKIYQLFNKYCSCTGDQFLKRKEKVSLKSSVECFSLSSCGATSSQAIYVFQNRQQSRGKY